MSILHKRIEGLCAEKGITGYRLCKDIGISPNIMTELKMGRRDGISAKTANKIASYFDVSVAYLLGEEEKPATETGDGLSDEERKFIEWFRNRASEKDKALVRMIVEGDK